MAKKQLPPTTWRNTSLFQNLKEVTAEGYKQMLEYERAGGELDIMDRSAKKYYERYYRRHKHAGSKAGVIMTEDAGEEQVESQNNWED